MSEIWSKWIPINGLMDHYYITSVSDNAQGFEIIMRNSNKTNKAVRIYFEDSVEAYRRTDESYTDGVVNPMINKYGKDFAHWSFFKVEDSEYLKWFFEKSEGMAEIRGWKFTHYSIVAIDSVLDIIDNQEPLVEHIE